MNPEGRDSVLPLGGRARAHRRTLNGLVVQARLDDMSGGRRPSARWRGGRVWLRDGATAACHRGADGERAGPSGLRWPGLASSWVPCCRERPTSALTCSSAGADADAPLCAVGVRLNAGKTLFTQVMEFVPWTSLRAHRSALLGQFGRTHVVVGGTVPCDVLRATDLTRESARHRGQSVGQRDQGSARDAHGQEVSRASAAHSVQGHRVRQDAGLPDQQLEASLYTCLQILSVSVFEKPQLSCALQPDEPRIEPSDNANQLTLFDF